MAQHKSAEKRIRQTERRTEVNRARLSHVRNSVRKVEDAIASGDKAAAVAAFKSAEPEMARGGKTRIVDRNTMSRKISRLSRRIKNMAV
jgi:small subunit ribosomal protein S20